MAGSMSDAAFAVELLMDEIPGGEVWWRGDRLDMTPETLAALLESALEHPELARRVVARIRRGR